MVTRAGSSSSDALDDEGEKFRQLVEPHWEAMRRLSRRLAPGSPDDLLQDALTLAWRKRATFDVDRGTARNWLLATVIDQFKKSSRKKQFVTTRYDNSEYLPALQVTSEQSLDIERAVLQLSARQQAVIALYYYLGYPVVEVGSILGCSEGTIKSTLFDGRRRLRDILGKEY